MKSNAYRFTGKQICIEIGCYSSEIMQRVWSRKDGRVEKKVMNMLIRRGSKSVCYQYQMKELCPLAPIVLLIVTLVEPLTSTVVDLKKGSSVKPNLKYVDARHFQIL